MCHEPKTVWCPLKKQFKDFVVCKTRCKNKIKCPLFTEYLTSIARERLADKIKNHATSAMQ